MKNEKVRKCNMDRRRIIIAEEWRGPCGRSIEWHLQDSGSPKCKYVICKQESMCSTYRITTGWSTLEYSRILCTLLCLINGVD